MLPWDDFRKAAPEAAAMFDKRLEATGLALLATTRSDGFPRISPVEPGVVAGRLYLGMMPDSTKSLDLRRDPRCCLHSATADKDVAEGDVKLFGRAVAVTDAEELREYAAGFKELTGHDVEGMGPFDLWAFDVTGASSLIPEGGDHLRITIWKEGDEERAIEKR